jgi:hypothetical protein
MDMSMMEGERFSMEASGIGGVSLGALVGLHKGARQAVHFTLGLGLPTGKVDARDDMPDCPDCRVDYPTQIGSGSWDLLPGLTWVGDAGRWSWGASWLGALRLGDNSEDYTFGSRHELSVWGVRDWSRAFSTSLRLSGVSWGDVDGFDVELDPMMAPTQDPDLQAGRRLDVLLGFGIQPTSGALQRHRLALEVGVPAWQDLDGPQLGTDWSASVAWQIWF